MNDSRKSGFTLIEMLVTALVVMFVLFILARSMDFVTRTVSGEYRLIEVERTLETAHRVMREDLEAMVNSPLWYCHVSTGVDTPGLAFLRYRLDAPGDEATEWVQYWREVHPEEPRLFQWVRYSGEADNRLDTSSSWWNEVLRADLEREVVLDDAVSVETVLKYALGESDAVSLRGDAPEVVDIRLVATTRPYPVVAEVPDNLYERVRLEDATWTEFRVRMEGRP